MTKRIRGGKQVRSNFKAAIADKVNRSKIATTKAAFVIASYSDQYVPIDTAALLNSRFVRVIPLAQAWRGVIGYSQNYAMALHERTDWSPRPPNSSGKRGGGFNASAKPKFLESGAEEAMPIVTRIFISEMRA